MAPAVAPAAKRHLRIRSLANAKHIATMGLLPIPNGCKSLRCASQQIEPLDVRSGVTSVILGAAVRCRLFVQYRPNRRRPTMVEKGHKQTFCTAVRNSLFDHFVGCGEERRLQVEAQMTSKPTGNWHGGNQIQSPYVSIASKQAEIMIRIAAEFGFTPASRMRPPNDSRDNPLLLEIRSIEELASELKPLVFLLSETNLDRADGQFEGCDVSWSQRSADASPIFSSVDEATLGRVPTSIKSAPAAMMKA